MSARLQVDTNVLVDAGRQLRLVATEFHGAGDNAGRAAAAVGHEGLAGALRSFESNGDDRREKMVEHISALAEQCSGVGDTFEQLDTEFAAALKGES